MVSGGGAKSSARTALEKANRADRVKLIGFDGQPEGKQAIRDGKIFADPIQFPDKLGLETAKAIVRYFEGEEVPSELLIQPRLYYQADAIKETNQQMISHRYLPVPREELPRAGGGRATVTHRIPVLRGEDGDIAGNIRRIDRTEPVVIASPHAHEQVIYETLRTEQRGELLIALIADHRTGAQALHGIPCLIGAVHHLRGAAAAAIVMVQHIPGRGTTACIDVTELRIRPLLQFIESPVESVDAQMHRPSARREQPDFILGAAEKAVAQVAGVPCEVVVINVEVVPSE